MSLISDKYSAWLATIEKIIKEKGCTKGDLGTLEGQLNHAVYGISLARHFLARLRTARNSRSNKKAQINLTSPILADLILWMEFLRQASTGISMNLIVSQRPNRTCWSDDSCPFGLSGFLLHSGRVWRLRIPKGNVLLYGSASINNLLEFLGMAINVLSILEG